MATANGELLVDYAYPCMMAEKALKELHQHMLAGDYAQALEAGDTAMADIKLTIIAIKDMKEKAKR